MYALQQLPLTACPCPCCLQLSLPAPLSLSPCLLPFMLTDPIPPAGCPALPCRHLPGMETALGKTPCLQVLKEQLRKALVQSTSREKERDILRFITNLFMSQCSRQ